MSLPSDEVSAIEKSEHVHENVDAKRVVNYVWDGSAWVRSSDSAIAYAQKITVSGANTYVAYAPMGTAQATAGWKVKKINVTGGDTVITWADGNANFDNAATDLTALSYS